MSRLSPFFYIYVCLVLVVAEASPDLDSWDHSLSELGFRVHDPASGVFQASVNSYTFVNCYVSECVLSVCHSLPVCLFESVSFSCSVRLFV